MWPQLTHMQAGLQAKDGPNSAENSPNQENQAIKGNVLPVGSKPASKARFSNFLASMTGRNVRG